MTRHLTLIQQNDIHAHVEPHHELRWRDGRAETWQAGGAAHIRALAQEIRREVGEACVHVDSGDAIHGTGPAQWTKGASVVPVLNAVGVELMTPGNWEFAFGPETLRERGEAFSFPVIACNVHRAADGKSEFAPTVVRELGGLRVGFVGITSPIVGRTMPRAFGAGLRFADAEDSLPQAVAQLRETERPDLVVLVSHYGFAQEVEIARRVQGIDVILGGHTHDVLAEPVQVGRTIITQAGAHGSYLTRLDLEVTNGRVCGVRHELLPVRAEGAADGAVADVVEETLRPHRERMNEVVGESRVLLHRGEVLESPMDHLITLAYLAATDADVALSHGWRYGTPIPPGPITEGDLWQMIPTDPELFVVRMRGAQLRRLLEESMERTFAGDVLRQQGGYVVRFAGMRAVARLNNPAGARLVQLEIGGAPVDADREYVVAAAGEQSISPGGERVKTGLTAINVVRRHLAENGPFAGAHGGPSLVAV